MVKILVTGAAGFIGFHLVQQLLNQGETVVGLDNLSPYYDVHLKKDRLSRLLPQSNFSFLQLDLADRQAIAQLFAEHQFEIVVNLAAQPGVRYSLQNPHAYVDSNLVGFVNVLEGCRHSNVKHLVFASSSSVYGANTKLPFSVQDNVDHPISLYAATKKANELMAHTYSHLYGIPVTGLRFFTVYGPWGRPDMAPFLFTQSILSAQAIDVYNYGKMRRDFTYVDDVVETVVRVMQKIPQPLSSQDNAAPLGSKAAYKLYNVGNHQPVELMDFITTLERCLDKPAIKNFLPIQPGDVLETYADVADLVEDIGFQPCTPLETGIQKFVDWYLSYYNNRQLNHR